MMTEEAQVEATELADLIAVLRRTRGDLQHVEAKRARDGLPASTRETLSAFSNTEGGVIILGLDENTRFQASGCRDAKKVASDLASMCSLQMEPPLRPLIEILAFEGVQLVTAEVPELERARKPCFYKGGGLTKGAFIRVHDGDQHMSPFEVQMTMANRGQPVEDEKPAAGAAPSDLDPTSVQAYLRRARENHPLTFIGLTDEEALRQAKVLVPSPGPSGGLVPSLAGLLAMGRHPQRSYPQLGLTFVSYPTTSGPDEMSGTRFLDNVSVDGAIPVMLEQSLAILRRNMSRRAVVRDLGRSDVWEYPETALREAIVNALVHRDLSDTSKGAQTQIEMYPDRLVIRNPGGLFGPVSVATLGEEAVSSSRNAALMRILEDVAIPNEGRAVCENRGSGIRAMLSSLRAAKMSPPTFRDSVASFSVTFPNHALLSDEVVHWIESLGEHGLTESQVIGLAILKGGADLDNASYRSATGVDSRRAYAELRDLAIRELVDQVGDKRWAKYVLKDGLAISMRTQQGTAIRRRKPADRRQEILSALGTATMSRAELAAATGLSDGIVGRWLKTLKTEGKVGVAGDVNSRSKHTKYLRLRPVTPTLFDQSK